MSFTAISTHPPQTVHGSSGITAHQHLFPPGSGNCRKRRAGIQRIDLSSCAKTKLIGGSNESLNEDGCDDSQDGLESPSSSECCLGVAVTDSEGEENLKRLRLCSQSSSSSPNVIDLIDSGTSSESEWRSNGHFLDLADASDVGEKSAASPPNLAELENAHESGSGSSCHYAQLSSGGLVLDDVLRGSTFELVGDGRNCKAVETSSHTMWHCQILKAEEFKRFFDIMGRMQSVAKHYSIEEFDYKSSLLLPLEKLRILRSPQRRGLVYILLPDHHGTLNQLMEESELSCPHGGPARLSEERAQPILKQIAALLEFCHRIGLYFRDFRLRKFVFTDGEKTRIRVNNVLDMYLSPEMECDSVITREFIPAYVAPEVLDKKNDTYGARAADVWAFGVLMFTLLNGRYPFFEPSPSPIALLRRIRAHRFSFPILPSITEPARWLILSLLCPCVEKRPSPDEILQAHWFREKKKDGHFMSDKWAAAKNESSIVSSSSSHSRLVHPLAPW